MQISACLDPGKRWLCVTPKDPLSPEVAAL